MKVRDLIKILEGCNPDASVFVNTECEGYGVADKVTTDKETEYGVVWITGGGDSA